jgi:protein-S-isoprenylcysteine O-methyltransferase Ste14
MRYFYLLFAVFSYFVALISQIWFIFYLSDVDFIETIYEKQRVDSANALLIDFGLLTLFALQHSIMARESFKKRILQIIPEPIERAFYTLLSGVAFIFICYFYQPIDGYLWRVESSFWEALLWVGFAFGWGLSLFATFIIDHFELFGLKQPYYYLKNSKMPTIEFKERSLYKFVRHPIQLGVLLGLWLTPKMSYGHLFLSVVLSIYIFIGLYFEERSLSREFGAVYEDYKKRVGMLLPKIG